MIPKNKSIFLSQNKRNKEKGEKRIDIPYGTDRQTTTIFPPRWTHTYRHTHPHTHTGARPRAHTHPQPTSHTHMHTRAHYFNGFFGFLTDFLNAHICQILTDLLSVLSDHRSVGIHNFLTDLTGIKTGCVSSMI